MLVNQNTFNLQSTITDDWGGSHRVSIDLEALASVEDWKIEISLPDNYEITEIYGGEITKEKGKSYRSLWLSRRHIFLLFHNHRGVIFLFSNLQLKLELLDR